MTIGEKVANLKGFAEGLKINAESDEGKVLSRIIDILEDLALTVSDLEDECAGIDEAIGDIEDEIDGINDLIDEIDEDLGYVEEEVYSDGCSCGCEDDFEDDYEVECPECGEIICVTEEEVEEGTINCPVCDTELDLEFEDDCDCECDCCCDEE